jgi:hypothetical protein
MTCQRSVRRSLRRFRSVGVAGRLEGLSAVFHKFPHVFADESRWSRSPAEVPLLAGWLKEAAG